MARREWFSGGTGVDAGTMLLLCANCRWVVMPEPSLQQLLDVAIEAAVLAGRRTLAHFNTGGSVELKADSTPVTVADRQAEEAIRNLITRYHPDHSILGEEGGATPGDDSYKWIIDPIDGTKSFIHGVPLYGVLIGVEVHHRPSVGVIYLPATDELITAADRLGCRWNGRRTRVSAVDRLEDATIVASSITSCIARSDAFERLASRARLVRGWGDAYGYALVATGRAELMLDYAMNPWDCAPMLPILREAGGHFSDWRGNPTIWGPDAFGCNAALKDAVLEILRTERKRGT
jgi:histidinol phosphatase-like enzyme (inositol monophosphatase family)